MSKVYRMISLRELKLLRRYWNWKVWTQDFLTPYRTDPYDSSLWLYMSIHPHYKSYKNYETHKIPPSGYIFARYIGNMTNICLIYSRYMWNIITILKCISNIQKIYWNNVQYIDNIFATDMKCYQCMSIWSTKNSTR